ncbi:uncharacterized protein DUF288 [Motilibacter rhizosphaerae]|uniref:Uncharacterized protein DUF288 n=1 Tax=Motilibacter rhizosphaerae TaxID=598652 RepID=A0A4Q7NVR8_9ACTN|nr:STELLO glycosyltransferase family protein [Motilibacter rhizosphaerae]RZS91287.1 uncharacterized protein DUF288 [Motilibacter rhizosphaerae]
MTRSVVITTINPPTTAVRGFAASGWRTYVAGDLKTPRDWACEGVVYVGPDEQRGRLAEELPHNHYSRKLYGYLAAVADGATVVADSDDDNIPGEGWDFPAFDGEYDTAPREAGWVNIYRSFTSKHIWPRGLPLDRVLAPDSVLQEDALAPAPARVGVWQALADGDPDVDAIYRLTDGELCTFDQRPPVVLPEGTLCPYNSQNTATREELLALLYLPATVTFRFTDILRGIVAQPVMWAAGFSLGFTAATVVQERNPHDYVKDFESEIPCYLQVRESVEAVSGVVRAGAAVEDNLRAGYAELRRRGIVQDAELRLLDAWLEDLAEARTAGRALA